MVKIHNCTRSCKLLNLGNISHFQKQRREGIAAEEQVRRPTLLLEKLLTTFGEKSQKQKSWKIITRNKAIQKSF
jgi:hypothetical protein